MNREIKRKDSRRGGGIRAAAVCMAAVVALGVSACHSETDQPETSDKAEITESMKAADAPKESGAGIVIDSGKENSGMSRTPGDPGQPVYDTAARRLSDEDLEYFQEYLNRGSHYGFLLSEYRSPEYINLDEVFYSGAGLEQSPMKEAERAAFLQAIGATGIDTDMVRLDRVQVDAFLKDKTGISLNQMKDGLDWVYLPEYDRYYTQHGDTNMRRFFCPKGEVKGNEYRIWCLSDGYSQIGLESIVTLKKVSGGYHFRSNEFIWDHFGFWKEGVDEPTAEALHFAVLSYKGDLVNDPAVINSVDYGAPVFDSDTRYYSKDELQQISWKPGLLSVFRNEIYARHGYIFKNETLNEFFGAYAWYYGQETADTFDTGVFNEYEKANLKLAVEMER